MYFSLEKYNINGSPKNDRTGKDNCVVKAVHFSIFSWEGKDVHHKKETVFISRNCWAQRHSLSNRYYGYHFYRWNRNNRLSQELARTRAPSNGYSLLLSKLLLHFFSQALLHAPPSPNLQANLQAFHHPRFCN